MRIFIDTSQRNTILGIEKNGNLNIIVFPNFNEVADFLEEEIKNEGLPGLIGITVGPGSFTGIRNGIAFVRSFTLTKKTKVFGFDTLKSIFMIMPDYSLVLIPSRRDKFFIGIKEKDKIIEEEWDTDRINSYIEKNAPQIILTDKNRKKEIIDKADILICQECVIKGMARWAKEELENTQFPLEPFYLHS